MPIYYNQEEYPDEIFDRNLLIRSLSAYYASDDLDVLKIKLRKDLKEKKAVTRLLIYTKFTPKELIFHLSKLFDNLFNSIVIRKFRAIIEELELESGTYQ